MGVLTHGLLGPSLGASDSRGLEQKLDTGVPDPWETMLRLLIWEPHSVSYRFRKRFFMLVDWIMMKPVFFLLPLFILSYTTSRFFGKSVCFICHSNETFLFYSPGLSLRPRLTVVHLTWLRDRRMILV